MKRALTISTLTPLLLSMAVSPAPGEEWSRFRGPNGTGISAADTIPTTWTEADINWKVTLPGSGHSQPVLWGHRIFLTSSKNEGGERLVLCLGTRDGATEWTRTFAGDTHKKHSYNSFASSTPAVDAERAYVVFSAPGSFVVRAFRHGGEEAWSREFGPHSSQHGYGASPIVWNDMVIVGNEEDSRSFIAALDAKTGKERWRSARRSEEAAYGTPCLYLRDKEKPELILSSHAHGISSLDPGTGELNWEALVFDKRTVSSPVIAGGLILGTCGSGAGGNFIVGVRPGGKGDVTATHLAYKLNKSIPYVPTPVALGDLLFLCSDRGVVSCVEAATGNVLYQERAGGSFSASPVCVKDRLFCVSEDGEVVVVAAANEFKVLARNALGEGSRTTPAVAGGRMYVRTYTRLFSIGGRPAASAGD
ncbi:MAG TPA: PQQ-binding-like beta-propeller repeat protein [Planctomycetota bacterium]|nr:PQQ-binding-like beta-propeller repeat protein [Planctomycetota bacterium]